MDSQTEKLERSLDNSTPLCLEQLQQRLNTLENLFDSTSDKAERQKILDKFVEDQIKDKDRYKHIFKTEQGSIYFSLETDESIRIKRERNEWKLQYPCSRIFYIDTEQARELDEMYRLSYNFEKELMDSSIRTTELAIGVTPIEFGVINLPPIKFLEKKGTIKILGDQHGEFASGFHQGHPVTEIIK